MVEDALPLPLLRLPGSPAPPPPTQVIEGLMADPDLGKHLSAPSVSYGSTNLYMRGALEAQTRPNLEKVWRAGQGWTGGAGAGDAVWPACSHTLQLHQGRGSAWAGQGRAGQGRAGQGGAQQLLLLCPCLHLIK